MGSTRKLKVAFFFLFIAFPLFAQNETSGAKPPSTVSLTAEISRLETLASGAGSQDRYNAFLALARLHQLSGNPEAVLKAYDGALVIYPDDGRALLEQARFLISLGEYERAGLAINALLGRDREEELLIQGRYLTAQLEAFRSGNTRALVLLADDPKFAGYRSGILYTLWKLTGLPLYRTLLAAEFPQSPEAKIASGSVNSAPTPLWLLFPGRDSIVLANQTPSPRITPPPQTMPAPAPVQAPASPAAVSQPVSITPEPAGTSGSVRVLQAGLFSREENALGLAERLKKAGFDPQIVKRQVNGNDHWAVCVSGGRDMNATIKNLKEAGFESFPVTIP